MSLRHQRKVLGSNALLAAAPPPDSEEEEEEAPHAKPKFNPFSLLSDEEDANEESEKEEEAVSAPVQPAKPAADSATKKSKKSKKKKGKGGKQAAADSDTNEDAAPQKKEDDDELERALRELNLQPNSSSASAPGDAAAPAPLFLLATPSAKLLTVQPRFLNASGELKRLFGSEVLGAKDSSGGQGRAGRPRGPGLPPGARRMNARGTAAKALRRTMFVQPKGHWPRFDGCVRIEPVSDSPGEFRAVLSDGYLTASELHEDLSYDPRALETVLQGCPYHLETLLAFHEMYNKFGEAEAARDLLEMAVFALEAGMSPLFDPQAARCYLPYRVPENRVAHRVFFAHMQVLLRGGTPRTALEVAKALLLMDPSDPLGVLHQIDYLCLRSNELAWLERLAGSDVSVKGLYPGVAARGDAEAASGSRSGGAAPASQSQASSLVLLPNFAYSLAMARRRKEDEEEEAGASAAAAKAGPSGWEGIALWDGGELSADEVLRRALALHPHALVHLLERLESKGFRKDGYWKSYTEKEPFASAAGDTGSASLDYLLSLFVERSSMLYRPEPVLAWLKRGVKAVVEAEPGTAIACGIGLEDWAAVRRQAFPDSTRNEYSQVDREAFLEGQQVIPQEALEQAQGPGLGPGPQDAAMQQLQAAAQAAQAAGGNLPEGAGAMQAFLQTLLPWVNPGQRGGDGQGGDGRVIGPEDFVDWDSEEDELDD